MVRNLFNPSLLRKILFIFIIASLVYAVPSFFSNQHYIFKDTASSSAFSAKSLPQIKPASAKDYTAFLRDVENKKVFTPSLVSKPALVKVDRKKLSRLISNLRLAGIISGQVRKAIIEDKKTKTTFHLRQGESFLDSIRVKKINKDSVILDFQGEDFELYL
jgi:type II secretory pathway component PulC